MGKQGNLFATVADDAADLDDPRKLARSTDPSTSHEAARKAVDCGTVAGHEARILAALRAARWPLTYREIARAAGMDPPAVARRTKAMAQRGLISMAGERVCTLGGRKCEMWRAK